jgi:hypothetical protein
MGSYEVAVHAFQELGLRLLIIMGEKQAKHVAREQRETLMRKESNHGHGSGGSFGD